MTLPRTHYDSKVQIKFWVLTKKLKDKKQTNKTTNVIFSNFYYSKEISLRLSTGKYPWCTKEKKQQLQFQFLSVFVYIYTKVGVMMGEGAANTGLS